MIQKELYLDTPDGKKIFCAFDRAKETYSNKAVILAHGLTGNPFEYIHMMVRNYFVEHGYDVYRLAFYWDGEETRKLDECTVKIQADDLTQVIDMVKNKYDKVYCTGHSYGGLTLLHSNPNISAISFWDSSYNPTWFEDEVSPLKGTPYFTLPWGSRHLTNPAMVEEAKNLTSNICDALANKIVAPAQIIVASEAEGKLWNKELYSHINSVKTYLEIEGADHCFTNSDTVQTLAIKTHDWFKKF